jgi:hypothetical protein
MFPEGKGGRCVGQIILPPFHADCLEIWEPQTSWNPQGLSRPVMGLLYIFSCMRKTGFRNAMAKYVLSSEQSQLFVVICRWKYSAVSTATRVCFWRKTRAQSKGGAQLQKAWTVWRTLVTDTERPLWRCVLHFVHKAYWWRANEKWLLP